MKRNTHCEDSKFKKSRQEMMADINKVASKARKMGFTVFVEIGVITIDDKKFLYKDLNKAKKYIRTSEPKSLDKWRNNND